MEERVFSRQELYDLIWSSPMASVAKDLAISDVGLAKVCRRHGIPHPGRGYWARKSAGKTMRKPSLPPPRSGVSDSIRFRIAGVLPAAEAAPEIPAEVKEWIEREERPESRIHVPVRVHAYHPLLHKVKQALEAASWDPRGARVSRRDGFEVSVAPNSVRRACLILHTLVTALEKRGFRLSAKKEWNHQSSVELLGEEVSFNLRERYRRRPDAPSLKEDAATPTRSTSSRPQPVFDPIGILRLTVSSYGIDVVFKDRDGLPLEAQLNAVIVAMVRLALEVHRPRRLEQEERERQRQEEEKRQREFDEKRSWFEEALSAWRDHERRTSFLSLLEARFGSNPETDDNTREYLAWARRYVDWADPVPRFQAALKAGKAPDFPRWTPRTSFRQW